MVNSNFTDTPDSRTGIYADIQNLQDISREILVVLIRRWPEDVPPPGKLNLYVRADHADLWRVWASHEFSDIEVVVKGVQHYTLSATKNAADMAIAVDAISDFNHSRVNHVAVVSDDSDFISLYAKLAEEVNGFEATYSNGNIPFLWVFTDRMGTRSALLQEFFPHKYIHVVDHRLFDMVEREWEREEAALSETIEEQAYTPEEPPVVEEAPALVAEEPKRVPEPEPEPFDEQPLISEAQREASETERIALQLIRDMPVGKFKSMDCQDIIRTNFPGHHLSNADGPAFGTIFRREVLPFMEERGVKDLGSQSPRQYEMTHQAKRSLARA
ncbi:MAG: NYN domain-containing protein [Dehalococcoidia bacterium]|nr:NYN domain-containing protein [Dehalococcoidia bacterium]